MENRKHEKAQKIELVEVSALVPYEKNPRKHGGAIDQLCKSIEEHGWTNPIIIDQKNRIIAGHGRRLAAIKLSLREVPCVRIEVGEAEYLRIMLEDNKIASLSKFDKKLHKEVMEILQGLDSAIDDIPGYSLEDIDKIFSLNTKETIDGSGDFGDSGEIDGEIDDDARVVSMTFKLPKKYHTRIKDVLTAIQKENELDSISESLIFALSNFKGTTKTIRK